MVGFKDLGCNEREEDDCPLLLKFGKLLCSSAACMQIIVSLHRSKWSPLASLALQVFMSGTCH